MTKLKFIKKEGSMFAGEVREKTTMYIMGGLGIVVGLAWNEAIKGLIEYFIPLAVGGLIAKFMYAIILTLVIVVVTTYLFRKPADQK